MKPDILLPCFAVSCLLAAHPACSADAGAPPEPDPAVVAEPEPAATPREPAAVDVAAYPWLDGTDLGPMRPLWDRFDPPAGFSREAAAPGTFASWLRGLPVRTDRVQVLSYRGEELLRPSVAVVAMDVGTEDLQQCADSAIRLHAEYLWSAGRAWEAAYHFTSGDRSAWKDWLAGERFRVEGSRVERLAGTPRPDTHATYRAWLDQVFTYAGTRSLARDSEAVATDEELRAGDFFVQGGSPGHAVVILDVVRDAAGRRLALVGQGFMPAEDFHVVGWPGAAKDGVWFPLPETQDGEIATPSWAPFRRIEARRFRPL